VSAHDRERLHLLVEVDLLAAPDHPADEDGDDDRRHDQAADGVAAGAR
jgi:hypothetical protein